VDPTEVLVSTDDMILRFNGKVEGALGATVVSMPGVELGMFEDAELELEEREGGKILLVKLG
jgi:hypothetical protein